MPNPGKRTTKRFFIGANTMNGFANYTDDIFRNIKREYIIKGGPGTGKSSLMKQVANKAEERGFEVEYYYCSSDSSSLDGIVIKELGVGMLDGTSPHCADPKYPGAREEILNLGDFWDREKLERRFDDIKSLTDQKEGLFGTVYKYLYVCGSLHTERDALMSECTDFKKADAAAERMIRRIGRGNGFKVLTRQISSVGMQGCDNFSTYRELCGEYWLITDTRGIGKLFFERLLRHAEEQQLETWVTRSAMLELDGMYFPEKRIAVLSEAPAAAAARIINTERFVIKERLSCERAKLRFIAKVETDLLNRVQETFKEIKQCHFALEDIYISAMDFDRINVFTDELIGKIF